MTASGFLFVFVIRSDSNRSDPIRSASISKAHHFSIVFALFLIFPLKKISLEKFSCFEFVVCCLTTELCFGHRPNDHKLSGWFTSFVFVNEILQFYSL